MSTEEMMRNIRLEDRDSQLAKVTAEACLAADQIPDYASLHEAYAVLMQGFGELWDQVRKGTTTVISDTMSPNPHDNSNVRHGYAIRANAIRVAATALRIAADARSLARK